MSDAAIVPRYCAICERFHHDRAVWHVATARATLGAASAEVPVYACDDWPAKLFREAVAETAADLARALRAAEGGTR